MHQRSPIQRAEPGVPGPGGTAGKTAEHPGPEAGGTGRLGGAKKKLEQCLADVAQVSRRNRELVCLLVEKVVVYPPDPESNCRNVEILWNF